MADYRLYFMGNDNHFSRVIELACETDEEAIEASQQHMDGHPMELWSLGRYVITLPTKTEPTSQP